MDPEHQHPCIGAHSLQVVAELSLSFGNNISFVDPEGADQPEEKMENEKHSNEGA